MTSFQSTRCFCFSFVRTITMFVAVVMFMVTLQVAQSFQAPSMGQHHRPTRQQSQPMRQKLESSYRRKYSNMMMLIPDQVHDLFVAVSMQHGLDISNHVSSNAPVIPEISTSSTDITQWIADASTTAVDTTQDDGGWWKAYINIFKSILTFVHSSIDGPLRSVGIEQTWGVSIFLFTASE